jgi:adenylylsulfate kinase|tara:strand:- start:35 stop:430 length:396 start_codon:yes stop_codon:yes gene_type:complete
MGLPGSGKTYLADTINKIMDCERINADEVRKKVNDWDFSEAGRIRQAKRMKKLSDQALKKNKNVIVDFICPTPKTRAEFNADFVIWMDTIKSGRFEDTNKLFVEPKNYDYRVKEKNSEVIAIDIVKKIQDR